MKDVIDPYHRYVILVLEEAGRDGQTIVRYRGFYVRKGGLGPEWEVKDVIDKEVRLELEQRMIKHASDARDGGKTITDAFVHEIDLHTKESHRVDVPSGSGIKKVEVKQRIYLQVTQLDMDTATIGVEGSTEGFIEVEPHDEDRASPGQIEFPMKTSFFDEQWDSQNILEPPSRLVVEIRDGSLSIGEILDKFDGSVEVTAIGTYRIMNILAEKFKRIHGAANLEKKLECEAHGFVYGALDALFRQKYGLDLLIEYRGGRGYIDMVLMVKGAGDADIPNAVPVIMEFKRAKGNARRTRTGLNRNLVEALGQIEEVGYAFEKPAIRTESNQAVLLGVVFDKGDDGDRNNGGNRPYVSSRFAGQVVAFEEPPRNFFIGSLISAISELGDLHGDQLIGEVANQRDELRVKARKALYLLRYSSYKTTLEYMGRMMLGEMAASDSFPAVDDGTAPKRFFFWEPFSYIAGTYEPSEEADSVHRLNTMVVVDCQNFVLKVRLADYVKGMGSRNKNKNKNKYGNRMARKYDDEPDSIAFPEYPAGSATTDNHIHEHLQTLDRNKPIISIHLRVHFDSKNFAGYLPLEHIAVFTGRIRDRRQVDYAASTIILQVPTSDDHQTPKLGTSARDFLKRLVDADTETPTDKSNTIAQLKTTLDDTFRGLDQFIHNEADMHAIVEGFVRSQHEHVVFSETTANVGRIDLFLRSDYVASAPAQLPGPALLLELKYMKATEIDTEDARQKIIHSALAQNGGYTKYIKYSTHQTRTMLVAIAYIKGAKDFEIGLDGRRVHHSSAGRIVCSPSTSAGRRKRSLDCWEEIEDDASLNEFIEKLREESASVNRESLIEYIKARAPANEAELVLLYKQLAYTDVSREMLMGSPCGNRLPDACVDQFNQELFDSALGEEHVSRLNFEDGKGAGETIRSRILRGTGTVAHYGNRLVMAIDVLAKVDMAIRLGRYGPFVHTMAYLTAMESAPALGRFLDDQFNKHVVQTMLKGALERRYPQLSESVLYRLSKYATINYLMMTPRAIALLPSAALSLYDLEVSLEAILDALNDPNLSRPEKIFTVVINSCSAVADVGYLVIAISGHYEGEPVIYVMQFVCNVAGGYIGHVMVTTQIEAIDLTFREKYSPILNNAEGVQRDLLFNGVAAQYVLAGLSDGATIAYDAFVLTLPNLVFFPKDAECNQSDLSAPLFVSSKRLDIAGDRNYYVVYPDTALAYILDSVRAEARYTASPSRTIAKIGQQLEGLAPFCSPTAPDATETALPDLVCGGEPAGCISVANLDEEQRASAARNHSLEQNFCASALGIVNSTRAKAGGAPMRVFIDVRAVNSSYVRVGRLDTNYVVVDSTSHVVGGDLKNIFALRNNSRFDSVQLSLNASAENSLVLECGNFTRQDAFSREGAKLRSVIGSPACPQEIWAGPRTSFVATGGNSHVTVPDVPSAYIYLQTHPRDVINLTHYRGEVFIDLFDSSSSSSSDRASTNFHFPLARTGSTVHFRLINQLVTGHRVLDEYKFLHDWQQRQLLVMSSKKLVAKIYTELDEVWIGVNFGTRVRLVFSRGPYEVPIGVPATTEVYYAIPEGNRGEADYVELARYLEHIGDHNTRIYAGNANGSVVLHSKRVELDFAFNSNSTSIVKLNGRRNLLFVEHCSAVEVWMDDTRSRSYSVYLPTGNGSSVVTDVSSTGSGDDLVVRYTCPTGGLDSSVRFSDLALSSFEHTIRIHAGATVTHIRTTPDDDDDYIGRQSFYVRTIVLDSDVKANRIHHFVNSPSDDLIEFVDLAHLKRLCIPDTHRASEITALRGPNSSLLLHREGLEKVLAFTDFFNSSEARTAAKQVQVLLRDEVVPLEHFATTAVDFSAHKREQLEELLSLHLRNGGAIVARTSGDFQIFLEKVEKIFVLFVESAVEDVTLRRGANGSLVLDCDEFRVTVHGWDLARPQHRPVFVLEEGYRLPSSTVVLDVTAYKLSELAKMVSVLERLR